jgi:regulation of enolase protein 1 (concanavalin A-like superfamily)
MVGCLISGLTLAEPGARADERRTQQIAGWGTATLPDANCSAQLDSSRLTLAMPAGVYDLWYGEENPAHRDNSPRVLRSVTGDFVATVKVTADWRVGKPLPSGRFSRVAGLLVIASPDHYLRHERNLFQSMSRPGVTAYWSPPLYDREKMRVSTWKAGTTSPFRGESTWLRLERAGQTLTASISHDGQTWEQSSVVPTTFPETVQVGVIAHQAADGEFRCQFEGFKLLN